MKDILVDATVENGGVFTISPLLYFLKSCTLFVASF